MVFSEGPFKKRSLDFQGMHKLFVFFKFLKEIQSWLCQKMEEMDILHVGVSKNNGTPKWMVYFMETPIKMDDLGGFPPIFGNTHVKKKNITSGSLWDVLPLLGAPKILEWKGSMEDMEFSVGIFLGYNPSDLSMAGVGIPVVQWWCF